MSYRRLLTEGEEVTADIRPHWWYLAGPVAVVVAVIAGAVTALVTDAPVAAKWVTLVALVVAVVCLVARYVKWSSTKLILTTSRIIERSGVFGRTAREIPLAALSDIGYHQSLFERIIGAGDVIIESSAKDGEEIFPDLPHPKTIKNQIYAQMRTLQQVGVAGPPTPDPATSIPDQIDQLDQLRRRGVISDAEFAAKKTELLGRL